MNPNLMMQLRLFIAAAQGITVPINYFPYNNIEEYFVTTDRWLFGLR